MTRHKSSVKWAAIFGHYLRRVSIRRHGGRAQRRVDAGGRRGRRGHCRHQRHRRLLVATAAAALIRKTLRRRRGRPVIGRCGPRVGRSVGARIRARIRSGSGRRQRRRRRRDRSETDRGRRRRHRERRAEKESEQRVIAESQCADERENKNSK